MDLTEIVAALAGPRPGSDKTGLPSDAADGLSWQGALAAALGALLAGAAPFAPAPGASAQAAAGRPEDGAGRTAADGLAAVSAVDGPAPAGAAGAGVEASPPADPAPAAASGAAPAGSASAKARPAGAGADEAAASAAASEAFGTARAVAGARALPPAPLVVAPTGGKAGGPGATVKATADGLAGPSAGAPGPAPGRVARLGAAGRAADAAGPAGAPAPAMPQMLGATGARSAPLGPVGAAGVGLEPTGGAPQPALAGLDEAGPGGSASGPFGGSSHGAGTGTGAVQVAPATVQAAAPDPAPGVEASTGAAGSADGPPQTAPALGLAGARPYHPGATSRADAALAPDGGGVPGHAWEGTARRGGESDPGAPPASLAPPGPADAPVSLVRDVSVDTGGGVRPAATAVHASRADLGAIPGPAASGAVLHADGTGEAVWQGRLDAGPLGPLTVRVAVHAQAVHAHLEALPDAVPTLRLTAPALAEALRTDGLLLAQFSVRADAGRGDFPATSDGRRGAAGGEKRTIEAVAGVVPAAHAAGRGAAHGAGLCEWRM